MPVILSPDGGKLSKRKGAASVMDYKRAGFLPQALFNFLALLGWNPGDDREVMTKEELCAAFNLEQVNPKSAVLDEVKLEWMNHEYMRKMTVEEALDFFQAHHKIYQKLYFLKQVGLDYIELGQPAPTLSGGEAQRIKLATELSKKNSGQTLYILDEPTTGLHFYDIDKLLKALYELVNRGNTVLVIEHNLDVIKNCQYIVDLGPEGGDKGGEVVYQGETAGITKVKNSYTGEYLKKVK